MTTLFDPTTVAAIKARLASLGPKAERQWGRMNVAQAMAHCSISMESAIGDHRPPRMLLGRIFGRFVKPLALGRGDMKRNAPTAPDMVITDVRDLAVERQRLTALIDRFAAGGAARCTTHPHTFFGSMTPDEWATLMYKHLDHHLRQFGA